MPASSSQSLLQSFATKNTVESVFSSGGGSTSSSDDSNNSDKNNHNKNNKKQLSSSSTGGSSNFPLRVVAYDTTNIPQGKGYTLSFEHALCVGRYTPDPSGAPVTKAVAPNRTTSAISVSEAEEAFKLGTDAISKMISVPPQSITAKKNLSGENNNNNENDDDIDEESSAALSSSSIPTTPVTLDGGDQQQQQQPPANVATLLSSMFKAAQVSSQYNKKNNTSNNNNTNNNTDGDQNPQLKPGEPPLTSYALSTKQKNVRTPPQNAEALQEVATYSVLCHAPNLNIPATVFFPVSYDWPRRKAAPDAVSPFEINQRDHAAWPPREYLLSATNPANTTSTTFCEVKTKKFNSNTALLYRIGPGAVAFRVVSNAFEAAGMTYTPGGCYDHVDYNDVNGTPPPIESSSTSASWNVLWAKRCDPIVLSQMNSFQKINHLPGSWSIGRKDNLHKCIQRLQKQHGLEEFGEIAPRSFIYPADYEELRQDVARNSVRVRRAKMKKPAILVSYRNVIRYGKTVKDPKTGEEYEEEEEFEEEEEAEEEEDDEDDEKNNHSSNKNVDDDEKPLKEDNNNINDDSKYETLPGLYIVKPCASSCGNGIRVCRGMPKFPTQQTPGGMRPQRSYVVQRYLEPFIVDERKFDLRLYVVLTGVNPLKVWLYDEGLVRFAAHKYTPDANLENSKIHLTNYSVGKDEKGKGGGKSAEADEDTEIKWTITDFRKHFLESPDIKIPLRFRNLNDNRQEILDQVQAAIDEVVVKTVMCMENDVRTECRKQCRDPTGRGCFEMFGVDVMLNSDLKPHIIEANIMPSLAATLDLDRAVKGRMLAHMHTLVGVVPFCRDREREDPTPPLGAFVPGVESGPATGSTASMLLPMVNNNAAVSSKNEDGAAVVSSSSLPPLPQLPMYVYRNKNNNNINNKTTTATATAADENNNNNNNNFDGTIPDSSRLHYKGGLNVPLLTDFNDPSLITESERLMLAEAEAEVVSSGGFRRIYPAHDSHEKYSRLFSNGICRNTWLLLSYAVAKHKREQEELKGFAKNKKPLLDRR